MNDEIMKDLEEAFLLLEDGEILAPPDLGILNGRELTKKELAECFKKGISPKKAILNLSKLGDKKWTSNQF